MTGSLPSPLGGPAPDEIPLSRSPLVKVIAQVRFSAVLRIDSKEAMAAFQAEIADEYPVLEQISVPQIQVDLGPGAVQSFRPIPTTLWRFTDADGGWLLSLGTEAVTLETLRYEGRSAFLRRWRDALEVVERIFSPRLVLRVGTRYGNRIEGASLLELPNLVRGNFLGIVQPEFRDYVQQALSEANVIVEEGALLLRWGIVRPQTTFDPGVFLPIPNPSWILDIDVSSAAQRSFSADMLESVFYALANRAYSVFRYAIPIAGLRHFGAPS